MNDEQAQQLGAYIRRVRTERDISIRALAAQAHLDSGGLARLEGGKVRTPKPNTLHALAAALNVPLPGLFLLAGYVAPHDLPSLVPYLRAKYRFLSDGAIDLIAKEIAELADSPTHNPQAPRLPSTERP